VGAGWKLKTDFLGKSTHRLTPLLELDDGTMIGEAAAICRYFEASHPEPRLFGRDAREVGLVDMWERKCEFDGMQAVAEVFRNSVPAFADRGLGGYDVPIAQIPALVDRGRVRMNAFFADLEQQLAGHRFIVDDTYTMADVTGLCAIDFGKRVGIEIPEQCPNVLRWYAEVSARPSAAA
jgi:glutathione S-transferase